MTNAKQLITLGEHRKIANDLLYFHSDYKESKNVSNYDALKYALSNIKFLISSFRSEIVIEGIWRTYNLLKTKEANYKIRNLLLFDIIKLMEFSIAYKGKTTEEIFPGMLKRPDAKAVVFTNAGISYLEAAFNFTNELGKGIILNLQSAYKKYKKESRIVYSDPFKFLINTPTIDDLVVNPEPDVIIKTWFEKTITSFQKEFPEQEYSQHKVAAEFNSVAKQIEYEWNECSKMERREGKIIQGQKQMISNNTENSEESHSSLIFISYSHKDKRWLDDLQTHLKPYIRNESLLRAWSDKQIAAGSKWFPEIKEALRSTKAAVLLVTPNFLASDFIHDHELTPLLKDAEKEKIKIIWIPVRACSYKETVLKDIQTAIDPEKPLANMKAERDKAWVKICEEIKKAWIGNI